MPDELKIQLNDISSPSKGKIITTLETREDLKKPRRIRVLIFGEPSTGKSHDALTYPKPIGVVDTEDGIPLLIHKFEGNIFRGKTTNFAEIEAVTDAILERLHELWKTTGNLGTIVVDSMTDPWEIAQDEYISKRKKHDANSEVKLNPRDDYKYINATHNNWRKKIFDSPFNIVLTAREGSVYEKDNQFEVTGKKPKGQKTNSFHVDYIIHKHPHPETGEIVGTLTKSRKTLNRFVNAKDTSYSGLLKQIERLEKSDKKIKATHLIVDKPEETDLTTSREKVVVVKKSEDTPKVDPRIDALKIKSNAEGHNLSVTPTIQETKEIKKEANTMPKATIG